MLAGMNDPRFRALLASIAEPLSVRQTGAIGNFAIYAGDRPLEGVGEGNFPAMEVLRICYEVERLELRAAAARA